MKTPILLLLVMLISIAGFAQDSKAKKTPKKSVTWKIDNLEKIGGHSVSVLGSPQIVRTKRGNMGASTEVVIPAAAYQITSS